MASGDQLCWTCGNWKRHCVCGTAAPQKVSPWLPVTVSFNPPQLTEMEVAEVRLLLEAIRKKEEVMPGWFALTFGTPKRFDAEAKASHEMDQDPNA